MKFRKTLTSNRPACLWAAILSLTSRNRLRSRHNHHPLTHRPSRWNVTVRNRCRCSAEWLKTATEASEEGLPETEFHQSGHECTEHSPVFQKEDAERYHRQTLNRP